MNVVVTGAAGKLGKCVVRELRAAGHRVTGADRRFTGLLPGRRRADLTRPAPAQALLAGADAVVHLANHPSIPAGDDGSRFADNIAMNRHVFDAARAHDVRIVVFASSIQVVRSDRRLGDPEDGRRLPWLPLSGDLPAAPTNSYALSKKMGEDLLRDLALRPGMSAFAVRFPALVKEPPALRKPIRNPVIDEAFTWLSFADAARLIRALLASPRPGFRTYLPAAARPWVKGDVEELRQRYFAEVPLKKRMPLTSFVDISAITHDTGWTPQDK